MSVEIVSADPVQIVKEATKQTPELAFVRAVQQSGSLVDRNLASSFPPYIHDVDIFLAFRQPHYSLDGINPPFADFLSTLRTCLNDNLKLASREAHISFRLANQDLEFPWFYLREVLGDRIGESVVKFVPKSKHAQEVLAQSGLTKLVYLPPPKVEPVSRRVRGVVYPSVPFAELTATCLERKLTRPFHLYSIPLENLAKLAEDEGYLQKMADECLPGYRVTGIQRPNKMQRLIGNLGLGLPST